MTEPNVCVTHRAEDRIHAGHPWIYRSDVLAAEAAAGSVARVVNPRRRTLGYAFYSDRSEIALRFLSRTEKPEGGFWEARLEAAAKYRESLRIEATAYRLVHGEGDLLPGLIVDRYGEYLVVQTLIQGTHRLLPMFAEWLSARTGAKGVLARNDARVRAFEGLEQSVEVVAGHVPQRIVVREGAVEYEVDLRTGQKTGLFLDQRENRQATAGYARGRALDCFSYHGSFALTIAPHCDSVTAIDISDEAIANIRANAARNQLGNVEARGVNVFDALREFERAGDRFDTIVLDPPAFAKNRASVERAISGYKEINLRALKILSPGGYLITCSCSYHVDEAAFAQVVYEAVVDAHVQVTVVEKRMQARDHPVLLGVPETYYLKCLVLRKVSG